jgi:hypothetical protein
VSLLLLFRNNAASGGSATLTAASGVYVFTGNAALFNVGMVESTGAYTFTGNSAIFNVGLVAAVGNYVISGANAVLTLSGSGGGLPESQPIINSYLGRMWNR